ncbi:MAG: histidine--tRNA ligase [Chloroflexota bacterium]
MAKVKPALPKGMRDFLPADMLKREYVFDTIRDVFHLYGFEPIQTPTMEKHETLFGKYGEDAENLIYSASHQRSSDELAMRYDLTVPLARVVAQYENDLNFPFKRYHIAPVWRGERPQRGRYREFYQCDVDIVGVSEMTADAEVLAVIVTVLKRLGFPEFSVKINSRKLLTAIGAFSGVADEQLPDLYRSVDKFDKIGAEGVGRELADRGIAADVVSRMMDLITQRKPGLANLDYLAEQLGEAPGAVAGVGELRELAAEMENLSVDPNAYEFDFTMVRGLGYYTGPIFETVITEPNLGSISGGGRYDELIGMFRRESMPTTGASLGVERIIDLLEELDLYPASVAGTVVQAMVLVFNSDVRHECTRITTELRSAGIRTELYLQDKHISKQFKHADRKGIPIAVIAGPDEIASGEVKLRRLRDGHEVTAKRADMSQQISALLTETQ